MLKNIFTPILIRYNVLENRRKYMLEYFINGLMAIVSIWLEKDCKEEINEIINIINICIKK